jgi:UDP-glucose 4-epimerase
MVNTFPLDKASSTSLNSSQAKTVLVTGANGFVGSALTLALVAHGLNIKQAARYSDGNSKVIPVGSISGGTDWSAALLDANAVVHLASRVHVMRDPSNDPLFEYRNVNVLGTLNLARQAAAAGVKRFVFLSSVKVHGESTVFGHPYTVGDIPQPADPYGQSKLEAEEGLVRIAAETGMEVVIIRSPLVYGPGVKANFLSMMNWLRRGIPLPLGGITKNSRSFVFIGNLVSMIVACINHPAAANQIFLVSDDEDLSTTGLLERMALVLGLPSRLIAVPAVLITLGAMLIGRADISQRLCGSLQVDIEKTKKLLGWAPPLTVNEGLRQTAAHFLKRYS